MKKACFVGFGMNVFQLVYEIEEGWIIIKVMTLVYTGAKLHNIPHTLFFHQKTIICEIGCSFTGTSDGFKPNHNVIHFIPFQPFYSIIIRDIFFSKKHFSIPRKNTCLKESEIVCGCLSVRINIAFWFTQSFDICLWMNVLKARANIRSVR